MLSVDIGAVVGAHVADCLGELGLAVGGSAVGEHAVGQVGSAGGLEVFVSGGRSRAWKRCQG